MTVTTSATPIAPNNRREIIGWMMYDWANSAFSTTVVTVFLGPYLNAVAGASADADGFLRFAGLTIRPDSFFSYCVSLSVFLQVFILPLLGAMADYSHLRKTMMQVFATIGAVAAMGLFFVTPGLYMLGGFLFVLANLTFGASIVFYNAYLPDIATPDQQDKVSSRGWGVGYLGGGLLLLLNLVLYTLRDKLGIDTALAVRICLLSAGVWWLGFAQITFATLLPRQAARRLPAGENLLTIGFKQLLETFREMRKYPETIRYLVAYLLYNDGIQTVISMSVVFGASVLGMQNSELIPLTLMVQAVAFVGAFAFGWLAGRIGAKRAVIISLVIWCAVVLYAYAFLQTSLQFWYMGAVAALVLGGSQALSRSLFSRMIPLGREAEFFSFYEVSERGTSWLGPFLFGMANDLWGSMRYGLLSLIVLFIGGLAVLVTVNVERAQAEAGRAE